MRNSLFFVHAHFVLLCPAIDTFNRALSDPRPTLRRGSHPCRPVARLGRDSAPSDSPSAPSPAPAPAPAPAPSRLAESYADLRSFLRLIAVVVTAAALCCYVDTALALSVLVLGSAQAAGELFGIGIGGRALVRGATGTGRSILGWGNDIWWRLRKKT